MPTIFRDKLTLGSVAFNDRSSFPLEGLVEWAVDVVDAWDSTAEIEMAFARIGVVDGEIPGETATYTGKQYTVSGYVHAEEREIAEAAWDLIVAEAIPIGVDVRILRDGPIPKFTDTRVNGPKVLNQWVGPTAFRWSAQVRAYDPFRYSVDPWEGQSGIAGQSSGGRTYPRTYPMVYGVLDSGQTNKLEVMNSGTASTAKWYLSAEGPLPAGSWRIVNETTGALLRIDVTVPAGVLLVVDMQNEQITLDNVIVTPSIIGDFFRLVRGTNVIRLFGEFDAAAQMYVVAYSAWE